MKTADAINRLTYTISKGNKTNDADKVALNSLLQYINNAEENTMQDHRLFAKLYTFTLREFLAHYKDIDFSNTQLNKELNTTLEFQIEKLKIELKFQEMSKFFKEKGLQESFTRCTLFIEGNKEIFQGLDHKELQEVSDIWDSDNVNAHLKRNINESINKFKNV